MYWTRKNRSYCKEQGIRLSDPKLGRPNATAQAEKTRVPA
ncbi:MAG: transposase [Pilosibacter sp.]